MMEGHINNRRRHVRLGAVYWSERGTVTLAVRVATETGDRDGRKRQVNALHRKAVISAPRQVSQPPADEFAKRTETGANSHVRFQEPLSRYEPCAGSVFRGRGDLLPCL
ncbi:unnamed protein product, partial [Iphiclides podalirius]